MCDSIVNMMGAMVIAGGLVFLAQNVDKKQPVETKEQPVETKEQPVETKAQPVEEKKETLVDTLKEGVSDIQKQASKLQKRATTTLKNAWGKKEQPKVEPETSVTPEQAGGDDAKYAQKYLKYKIKYTDAKYS